MIIFSVLIMMVFIVYIKVNSSDIIFSFLDQTVSYYKDECKAIFSTDGTAKTTFFKPGEYACRPVSGNRDSLYLTILLSDGLMFGIINIVGNFGKVFDHDVLGHRVYDSGSAESIAVLTLVAYDICHEYINPEETGEQIPKRLAFFVCWNVDTRADKAPASTSEKSAG